MKSYSDLLDIDTWAQVVKAAPKVTTVPFDAAQAAIKALGAYMRSHPSHSDLDRRTYWEASLKEVLAGCTINMEPVHLGRGLRLMGLTLWREGDGYHVAWSEEQFKILKKALRA